MKAGARRPLFCQFPPRKMNNIIDILPSAQVHMPATLLPRPDADFDAATHLICLPRRRLSAARKECLIDDDFGQQSQPFMPLFSTTPRQRPSDITIMTAMHTAAARERVNSRHHWLTTAATAH